MKIKATKAMANFLKKSVNLECVHSIKLLAMDAEEYKSYVDFDMLAHIDDYDYGTLKFKVIQVNYKIECYAIPKYLTTKDLLRCYKHSNGTAEDFVNEICKEIEI